MYFKNSFTKFISFNTTNNSFSEHPYTCSVCVCSDVVWSGANKVKLVNGVSTIKIPQLLFTMCELCFFLFKKFSPLSTLFSIIYPIVSHSKQFFNQIFLCSNIYVLGVTTSKCFYRFLKPLERLY